MDSTSTPPTGGPRFEPLAGWILAGAYLFGAASVCLAGGGIDNVGRYLMDELQHFALAIAGKEPMARNQGDPTLPGYFVTLSLSGIFFFVHAVFRGLGRDGFMPNRSLWRWSATHAVVSTMWMACVIWPQVVLVGWGIVSRAWAGALVAYTVQFLVSIVVLARKRT